MANARDLVDRLNKEEKKRTTAKDLVDRLNKETGNVSSSNFAIRDTMPNINNVLAQPNMFSNEMTAEQQQRNLNSNLLNAQANRALTQAAYNASVAQQPQLTQKEQNLKYANEAYGSLQESNPEAYEYLKNRNSKTDNAKSALTGLTESLADFGNSDLNKNLFRAASGLVQRGTNALNEQAQNIETETYRDLIEKYGMSKEEAAYWDRNYAAINGVISNNEAANVRNEYIANYSDDVKNAMSKYIIAKREWEKIRNTNGTGINPITGSNTYQDYQDAYNALKEAGIDLQSNEYQLLEQYMEQNYGEAESDALDSAYSMAVEQYPALTVPLNAYTYAFSPYSGLIAAAGTVMDNLTKPDKSQPTDTNRPMWQLQNLDTRTQNVTNEAIQRVADRNGVDAKYGQFAYGTGSSIARSIYGMAIGGAVGESMQAVGASDRATKIMMQLATLPSFGGSAYSSTLKEALESGMGEEQAQNYAVASGINEMLFEELSLDKAWGSYAATKAGKTNLAKRIFNVIAQAGIEGSEEVFTDLSNTLADNIINSDMSEYNTMVRNYMEQNPNATEEEARAYARTEYSKKLGETFLAGAISGGVTGGVSTAAGMHEYRQTAKNLLSDSAKMQSFVESVKASAPAGSTAANIVNNTEVDNLTANQVADVLASLAETGKGSVEEVVTDAFIRAGETEEQAKQDAQTVLRMSEQNIGQANLDEIADRATSENRLTAEEIESIKEARKVSEENEKAVAQNPTIGDVLADYQSGKLQSTSTIAQAAQQVAKQERAQERAEKIGAAFDKVTQPIRNVTNKINEGKMHRNAVFQAEHDANTVEVLGVDSVKSNGKIMLNTSEGRMDIADLNVDNKQEAVRVLNIIATTENAKAINYALKNFDANFSYASAVLGKQAFHMGQNGVSIDKLLNGNDKSTANALALLRNSDPTDAYLKAMYGIGVNSQEKREVKNVDKDKYETIKAAKKDGFDVAENDELRDFKKAVKDFGGFNFITDYGETRFNGSWMVELATMTSSNGTNEFAAITHEMMEFAESLAPEAYKKLSDSVMNLAVEQLGWSEVNDIIKKYQEAYRKSGLKGTANKTYEQAKDEFINDFMSGAFSTEEGAKQFIEHITNSDEYSASDKVTILESFAEWVDHLLDTIKNFLTKPQQLGGEVAMKLEKAGNDLTEIRKLAFKALDEAKAELQRQLNTEMNNIVKADIKENAVPEETEFSLKMPIEQTDKLVALHNLNEENLLRTLKLGGFAMPSIAVTKSDMLHENFGNITALFDKSVVQPNQVYSGDAYTPMFPHIDYQVDRDKLYELEKEINANMDNVPDDFKNDVNKIISRLEQDVEVNGFAGAVERMSRDYGMIQYYLGLQNKAVQTIKTQTVKELTDFQIENAEEIIKRVPNIKEVSMFGREAADKYGEAVKDAWRYLLEKDGYTEKEISDIVDSFDPAYIKKELINAKNYAIKGARQVTETEDYTATRKAILDAVDKDEFKSWLIDKLDGIEARAGIRNNKDTFTPSGKRRSFEQLHEEITLENVVKSMLQEKEKGGAALFSVNSIFGASTRAFKSIDEMKKEMGRLQKITDDEIKEARSGFISRLTEIGERMIHSGMTVSGAIDAINDAVAASKTKAQLVREMNLNKQWYNVDDEIIEDVWNLVGDIAKMPTTYFEAKPRRAVGFDEIEKLLVPDNASKKLFTELDSRNIPYSTYEHGNSDDRLAKLNQAVEETGAAFSINVGMTDEDRFNELDKLQLKVVPFNRSKLNGEDILVERMLSDNNSDAMKAAKELAKKLGVVGRYSNKNIDFEFDLSNRGIGESINKLSSINDELKYVKFSELATSIASVIDNAQLIKVYSDLEYVAEHPEHGGNERLDKTYVLASAFSDDDGVVPVKITVMEYTDKTDAKIHLILSLPTLENSAIKKAEIAATAADKSASVTPTALTISLSELLRLVKNDPYSQDLGEYIPAQYRSSDYLVKVEGEYNKALNDENFKNARRMLDLYAKEKGYSYRAYHGSRKLFDSFRKEELGTNTKTEISKKWFFASDKATANSYYPYGTMKELEKQNPRMFNADSMRESVRGKLYDLYLNIKNPLVVDVKDYDYVAHREKADAWMEYVREADKNGNDGIILLNAMDNQLKTGARESTVYMFRNPNQAKSAETVTYDSDGNVIPLSKRFDSETDMLSYSINVDAAGNKLSEQQVKFFEKSVVRDAEGRLIPMYHGTPNGDFEVFHAGSYFSDMKWYADEYQSQGASMLGYKKTATNPKTYAVYLNITKPFDTRNAAERKIFEDQFYRKWGTGSPLTERGLIDWTDVEDMKEFIEDNDLDYDGIIADEGGVPDGNGGVKSRGFSYIPMNGKQQVKSISNINPTEDERIDYSINVDSDGNNLSEKQREFFKNSKAVDENGNLLVMYHGTENGSFDSFEQEDTVANANFFTNRIEVAKAYSGSPSIYAPKNFESVDDFNEFINSKDYHAAYEDGKYSLYLDDDVIETADNLNQLYREFWYASGETDAVNYKVYLNAVNPYVVDGKGADWDGLTTEIKGESMTTNEVVRWAREQGYDSVIFNNITDNGLYMSSADRNTVTSNVIAVMSSEQIKSVNNTNPTENDDIRYSIDVGAENFNAAIQEMEENINGGVARLANNLSQLMDFKSDLSKRMVSKVASNLKKSFGSDMNTKELETKIMRIFNYLRETGSVSPEDIELIRTTIGEPLVDAIKDYDPAKADEYDKFVAGVKTWDIALNDEQMQEVRNKFDSYYGFKRYMSGKLNLNKNGTLLDDIWTEICDLSGGALSYGTNPNNQPLALAEYINSLEPKARMLDEESYESASMKAALEVFREFFVETANKDAAAKMRDEITEYNKAVKDRYKKLYNEALKEVEAAKAIELERLYKEYENLTIEQQQAINEGFDGLETVQIQQLKEDYKQRIQKLKEQDAEKLAKVKADYKNKQLKDRENKAWIEAKHKLVKEVTALQNMLAHPKEAATKHVPVQLVNATIDLLNALQMDNGRNKAVTERLAKLAETYEALKSDVKNDDGVNYGFDYDERIAADIEEIKQIFAGGKFYTDLYTPEIERIIEIVQALKTQIKNANNLIINGQIEDARNVAAGAMDEVLSSRFHSNKVSDALNVYSIQHLNAYREFRKLGGYTDGQFMRLYDDIEQASLKEMQIQKELGNIYSEVLKNNKEMKRFISTKADDLVDIGIKDENGKPVMVSRAMRMSIIMHSLNEGNMRHIIFGGMTVPNMEYLNKDKQSAYGRFGKIYRFLDYQKYLEAVANKDRAAQNKMLTEARTKINSLVNDLSEWEQKFLEAAKTMFHEKTGEYINDTSVTLKGYTIARVKNYFPINTNKRFVPTDFAGLIMNGTVEGMGMLKERVQSSKPIMLEDITDVIQRSIKNTAKYAAYAIPVRNINMAMKQTFRDNRGEMTTLEQRIDEVWGKNDIKYLQNFITDIQNGRSGNESFQFMNKLRGNFAGAVLSLNPSVAIKQAASYPTAAAVLGYGPLARASVDIVKGSFFRQGIEELEKRNPLLWYRNQGYATQDMADAKAAGFGKNLPLWMQKAIGWTQFMDSGTVKTLQYASKYYVDSHYKNLKQGSNAYWDKVSEVFTQVVTETQPNYDTVHKADVIRDPNQFKKMLVMFKTQPMQNFGIIYDSLGELNANVIRYNQDKSSANKAKLNASIKKFAQSVSSQLMSALTFSAMTILANLLLHRWNKYRDDDDEWSWLRFFTALGEGTMSALTGMLLGGSIVYELIKFAVNKTYLKNSDSDSAFHNVIKEWAGGNTRFSGVEVSTVETINDLVTNVAALTTNATGIWNAKTGAEREAAIQKTTNSLTKVVGSVGEFTGIPANNLKNLFGSIAMYIMDAANGNGISSQSNIAEWEVSTQYERMYQALQDNDINAYNDLLNEQLAAYPDKDISDVNEAIRKIIKEDYLSGEIGKDETIDYLEAAGWDESTSELKIHQWETGTSSDYENLNNLIGTAADDPNADNRKALVAEIDWLLSQGKKKDKIRDSLKRKYAETYKKEYDTGDVTNLNSVLRQALTAAGYTDSEAADILKKWLN